MKKKPPGKTAPKVQRVLLKFQLPHASSVVVSGSFNNWDEAGVALDRDGEGFWFADLELAAGRHEYRLIVDGEWTDVPESEETVPNPFGSRNAVLTVSEST